MHKINLAHYIYQAYLDLFFYRSLNRSGIWEKILDFKYLDRNLITNFNIWFPEVLARSVGQWWVKYYFFVNKIFQSLICWFCKSVGGLAHHWLDIFDLKIVIYCITNLSKLMKFWITAGLLDKNYKLQSSPEILVHSGWPTS